MLVHEIWYILLFKLHFWYMKLYASKKNYRKKLVSYVGHLNKQDQMVKTEPLLSQRLDQRLQQVLSDLVSAQTTLLLIVSSKLIRFTFWLNFIDLVYRDWNFKHLEQNLKYKCLLKIVGSYLSVPNSCLCTSKTTFSQTNTKWLKRYNPLQH